MSKLSKAVRQALAYVYATGYMPSHIRHSTWSLVNSLIEGEALAKRVRPHVLAEVRTDPLAEGHDFLTALGFKPEGYALGTRRRTSQYVAYRHPEHSAEALTGRGGGCSVTRVNDARPYRQTWNVTAEEVRAALAKARGETTPNQQHPSPSASAGGDGEEHQS